jgi:hypothetical protein
VVAITRKTSGCTPCMIFNIITTLASRDTALPMGPPPA